MVGDKREKILDAAFEKFEHYGFAKTTVDEIAQQAQVGKGTIYSYFKSKEAILVALVDREFSTGIVEVNSAMLAETSAALRLKAMLKSTFDFFHKNALVGKVMAMNPELVLSVIKNKNKDFQSLSIAGIKFILKEGISDGEFHVADLERTAYIIDALIRSFHYLNYLGLDMYQPDELVESVFELIYSGLRKR